MKYYVQAMKRILEINEQLPPGKKIRVISMSVGWEKDTPYAREMEETVQQAKKTGLLVVCSNTGSGWLYGYDFSGMGRYPLVDPDNFRSYEPASFQKTYFFMDNTPCDSLMVPMDSRTLASETGQDKYYFSQIGGYSWAIPYFASLYVLAVQVNPGITPDQFWKLAIQTSHSEEWQDDRKTTRRTVMIVDPVKLINAARTQRHAR